ncbi:DNA ligase [Klebsiella phage KNP2]|uniref:DNA ligase n=1 Tax=Klebsiella phage KNP2 TaxID=1871716 RepID=UPI0018AD44B3|nr:DNA ligase [Klebsiella phage KNP2]
MFKRLINWLFAKDDETTENEVRVFDFTEQGPGHDIAIRVINDGEYAEAVVALKLADLPPAVGDFIVVVIDGAWNTFVVDTSEPVALGITQLTMSHYEGAENA